MKIKNNQFILWTSAFTLGFCMVVLTNFVFANIVDSIDDNPENGASVYPVLNEVRVSSGIHGDTHNVNITPYGQINMDVVPNTDEYAIDITSNKGGINIASEHDALFSSNKQNDSGDYRGMFGIKNIFNTKQLRNGHTIPISIHSYIGYLAPLNPDFDPVTDDTSNPILLATSKPYAFYTPNGDTYLGDDVESNGEISNPATGTVTLNNETTLPLDHPVNILSNMDIDGPSDRDLEIDGDLHVKTMEFSDPDVIRSKIGIVKATTWTKKEVFTSSQIGFGTVDVGSTSSQTGFGTVDVGSTSSQTGSTHLEVNIPPTQTFSAEASCPTTTYLVGCSGDISDAKWNALYKGSYTFGDRCISVARNPATLPDTNFHLNAYAYCFNAQSNQVTWSQE